ncbi:MAG: efflux transporter outer membrane subunit [Bacteroides sp.]|nr:efflux transporter outer membrane subunit [Bacteroides sp.]
MKKTILYILLATVVSGCGTYSNYKRPNDLPTDGLYGAETSVAETDTVSIASLSWKELFTDHSLQALIDEGLQANTDLRIARLKVDESKAALMSARLAFLPSVSLTPQGTLSSFDGSKTTKTYSLGASASWELDFFGRLRNAKQQAKANLEQSLYYKQAVQSQLIASIAECYYTLLMLDKQISISERSIGCWEENLRAVVALKKAGTTNEQAVAQSEANLKAARSSLLSLKEQQNATENSLCLLLGQTPHSIERGTLDVQEFPEELSVGVPLQLLSRRPDIRQSEMVLAAAFYATGEARSSFYPSVTLSGTAGWTNTNGLSIVNPGKWLLSAVGSLVQPLFDRGTNIARLKIAKAQQEEALLSFRQDLLNAGTEVNEALTAWQLSKQRSELNREEVILLQRALHSAEQTMKYGNTTYLEVLTAQQSLLQAELSACQEDFNEVLGVVSLYHALGGGSE